jgi:rare lipoprotein A
MKLSANLYVGAFVFAVTLAIGGFAAAPAEARDRKAPPADVSGPAGDYPVTLGDPFLVNGTTYTPADTLNYDAVGTAVLLDAGVSRISGAHRTLPVPSYVEVTSLDSGRTILVRLDQRGPMTGDGLVALSPMAWAQLGLPVGGNAPVRVRRVNPPEQERALLRTGQTAPLRMDTPAGLLAALRRKLGVEPPVGELPVTIKPTTVGPNAVKPDAVKVAAAKPPKVGAKPAAAPKAALPAKPAPAPKPVPVVSAPSQQSGESATVAAKQPASASGTASSGRYYVQVGAFSQRANAELAARKAGGSAVQAGRVWRVRSGPYASTAQADTALAKARRAGYADARTVHDK